MKKVTHYLKLPFLLLFKIIIAIMMGLRLSMGKSTFEEAQKNDKNIEAEK